MSLGNKLMNLRKKKGMSQEEVADKLNVTRQTVSKWETDQSTPDFDKLGPLCDLFGISADELLRDKVKEKGTSIENIDVEENRKKRAMGIGVGVILYFIAVVFIMISIPVLMINPIIASSIFLLICAVATGLIVYVVLMYKIPKTKKEEYNNKVLKEIEEVLALVTVIIYLYISFMTKRWDITWIIWIIFALVNEVVKLLFLLRGKQDEE